MGIRGILFTQFINHFTQIVVTVQVDQVYKRTTDRYACLIYQSNYIFSSIFTILISYGSEVIPDFTGKKPNAANAGKLTHDELMRIFGQSETATAPLPPGLDLEPQLVNALHPKTPGSFDLWGDIDYMNKITIKPDQQVRFLTKGNSFFIQKLQNAEVTFEGRDDAQLLNQIVQRSDTYLDDDDEDEVAPAAGTSEVADDEWD